MDRSAVMRRVKAKNTTPEIKLRRLLWGAGYRYRLHAAHLPGRPDVYLPGRKTAIFVHGCFWHGHDCPRGARTPKTNAEYWSAKIARNQARDAAAVAALEAAGWRVAVVWECGLRDADATLSTLRALLGPPGAGAERVGALRPDDGSGEDGA